MNENNNVVNNQVPGQSVTPQVSAQPSSTGGGTSGAAGAAIICDKCGTSYSSSQRYCMKCGSLNYSHPSNQSMKQYLNYDVVNQSYVNSGNAKLTHTSVDPYEKEKKTCIIVNLILHMIWPVLLTVLMIMSQSMNIGGLIAIFLLFGLAFILNASLGLIFIKAREPWWFNYIPILNVITIAKIAFGSGIYVLLFFIPLVNIIAMLVCYYNIGKRFGYNGWLTMFFPLIMIPVIGFSNSEERVESLHGAQISLGDDEFDSKGRTKTEAEYGKKKGATTFGILLVVGIAVVLLFPYIKEYGGDILKFFVDKYHEFVEFIGEMN